MSGSGCQISAHGVTVAEMVTPFMESVPDKELFLLDLAAELLLKCAASPELFETEIDYLLSTISQNTPQPSTLENMAKLIIIWVCVCQTVLCLIIYSFRVRKTLLYNL